MPVNVTTFKSIINELESKNVQLVAVSKLKLPEDIMALYKLGQRDFGENYVRELTDKQKVLPEDIRWHFIGHLQSNKVKYIAPFVHLIHGVDSLKLLQQIHKEAVKQGRVIACLLQVNIAREETKFGLDEQELREVLTAFQQGLLTGVEIKGLMGMASFTENEEELRKEFGYLKGLLHKSKMQVPGMDVLSMGMSNDYKIAIEEGSTMVRIGSLLFGARAAST